VATVMAFDPIKAPEDDEAAQRVTFYVEAATAFLVLADRRAAAPDG
jgi:hypothetical protein